MSWATHMEIVSDYEASTCRFMVGNATCNQKAIFKVSASMNGSVPRVSWRCCNHAALMAARLNLPFPPVRQKATA